jgi:hypothetical protein
MNDLRVAVVRHAGDEAPALRADGVVGEPVRRDDVAGAATFIIEDLAFVVVAVLVSGDDFFPPTVCGIVVVGEKLQAFALVDGPQVEVLPQDIRLKLVDDLFQLVVPELIFTRPIELAVELLEARIGGRGRELVLAGENERRGAFAAKVLRPFLRKASRSSFARFNFGPIANEFHSLTVLSHMENPS